MKKITGDAEEKGNLGQFPFSDIQELHTERWRGVGGGRGLLCLTFKGSEFLQQTDFLTHISFQPDLNYKFC